MSINNPDEIKTFAFFDVETTGLPNLECFKTKITELSIVACSKEHLLQTTRESLPRVLHKLTLCFNPFKMIQLQSSDVTNLTNELLENENKLNENSVKLMELFLSHLQQPICLIAHNGNNFDFPLLKKEFLKFNDQSDILKTILCCDSLDVFRQIENERLKKYRMMEWINFKIAKEECELEEDAALLDTDENVENFIKKELDEINEVEKQEIQNQNGIENGNSSSDIHCTPKKNPVQLMLSNINRVPMKEKSEQALKASLLETDEDVERFIKQELDKIENEEQQKANNEHPCPTTNGKSSFIYRTPKHQIKIESDKTEVIPLEQPSISMSTRQLINETTPVKPTNKSNTISTPIKRPHSFNEQQTSNHFKRSLHFTKKQFGNNDFKKGYFTLSNIYFRLHGSQPTQSHYAESDVINLIKCAIACKEQFVDITENLSKKFEDVTALKF